MLLNPCRRSLETPRLLQRALAYAQDLGLVVLLSFGLSLVVMPLWISVNVLAQERLELALTEASSRVGATLEGLMLLSVPLIYFLYFAVSTAGFRSTWGKRMQGLQVISLRGGTLTPTQCLLRELARPVDLCLAPLIMVFSPQSRTLGDHLAGTQVVCSEKTRAFERLIAASAFRSLYMHLQPRWVESKFCEFYLRLYVGDWTPQTLKDLEQMARSSLLNSHAPISQEEMVHFFAEFCQQTLEQRRAESKKIA